MKYIAVEYYSSILTTERFVITHEATKLSVVSLGAHRNPERTRVSERICCGRNERRISRSHSKDQFLSVTPMHNALFVAKLHVIPVTAPKNTDEVLYISFARIFIHWPLIMCYYSSKTFRKYHTCTYFVVAHNNSKISYWNDRCFFSILTSEFSFIDLACYCTHITSAPIVSNTWLHAVHFGRAFIHAFLFDSMQAASSQTCFWALLRLLYFGSINIFKGTKTILTVQHLEPTDFSLT